MANPAGIAVIHSVFNIFATVILLPFHRGLEKLAILTVRTSDEDEKQSVQPAEEGQDMLLLLDDRFIEKPWVCHGELLFRYLSYGRAFQTGIVYCHGASAEI